MAVPVAIGSACINVRTNVDRLLVNHKLIASSQNRASDKDILGRDISFLWSVGVENQESISSLHE